MKISYSWLRDYIDLDVEPHSLAEVLTMLGFEVEEIIDNAKKYEGFLIAHVDSKIPHPDADKLSLCTVSYNGNSQTVVCGAPNVEAGQNIILGLSGATVPSAGFQLSKRKIRGIESNGMICSKAELNLGEDSDGIWVLNENAPVGTNLSEYLHLNDVMFDIFITPNRSDGNSHIGIARELSKYYNKPLNIPKINLKESNILTKDNLSISIENNTDCPRYIGRIINGINKVQTPEWIKTRLTAIGLRPISPVVDITNYVMMETGNPLHAFDLNKLEGNKIIIKNANQKEKFISLDEKERELNDTMLMINDGDKPIAIAGVMGGLNSEISENTQDVMIEVAYFNPSSVRATARKLAIQSDSSYRFERGVDYNNLEYTANRACQLILETCGGDLAKDFIDIYPNQIPNKEINLRFKRVNKILGTSLTNNEIVESINNLKFEIIKQNEDSLLIVSPSFRVDINSEIDIIEDIAISLNYDNMKPQFNTNIDFSGDPIPQKLSLPKLRNQISTFLINNGFNESLTQNQIDPDSAKLITENPVLIANPLGQELSYMRPSLIPSMLKVIARNLNLNNNNLSIFEIGNTYAYAHENEDTFVKGYKEKQELCLALVGNTNSKQWGIKDSEYDFYDIKGIIQNLSDSLRISSLKFKSPKQPSNLFNPNSLGIFNKKKQIGTFGEISKTHLKKLKIDKNVLVLSLDLTELYQINIPIANYSKISPYPTVERDLAFLVDKTIQAEKILNEINQSGGKYITETNIFDLYQGKNIEENKKSIAFNLKFSSPYKTLTDEEIEPNIKKIIKNIQNKFKATLRDN